MVFSEYAFSTNFLKTPCIFQGFNFLAGLQAQGSSLAGDHGYACVSLKLVVRSGSHSPADWLNAKSPRGVASCSAAEGGNGKLSGPALQRARNRNSAVKTAAPVLWNRFGNSLGDPALNRPAAAALTSPRLGAMGTRSRVLGSGLRESPASRPAQDPSERHAEHSPLQDQRRGLEAAPGNAAARATPQHAGPSHTGAYTLIAPNEHRRNQIQRIAEQELANLEKWKEQNRAKPVHLVPRRLGGSQSETEVRQRQQFQLMQSKHQKKLKREESARIRKEAEEAELQKMKAVQREKSNKLEEKKRLQESLRREAYREHHQHKTAEFLSRLDAELPNRSACQIAPRDPQSSAWARSQAYKDSLREEENRKLQRMKDEQRQKNELLELKRQQQEEERAKMQQSEHRRVNNAFLDRLQGKSQPGGLGQSGGYWNMNSGNSWKVEKRGVGREREDRSL
ncbi:epithelial-stromal interaction protein 1 isoform X2 [Oryctolagus cuniculus]|uniref:epithelial-stromal interaction protein 1 isoform X2 n=1 Tax=Oryctolagus cuniculus TaxID=9986 RepID=UPI003879FF31